VAAAVFLFLAVRAPPERQLSPRAGLRAFLWDQGRAVNQAWRHCGTAVAATSRASARACENSVYLVSSTYESPERNWILAKLSWFDSLAGSN
jgi:hypothetical protein